MTTEGSTKSKIKEALSSVVADHDRNLRILGDDMKAFSLYAKSKVKNIQDRRRRQKQLQPTANNLVYDVNQGAGSEILTHFKQQWNDIHHETADISEKTELLYQHLQKLYSAMSNAHQIISLAADELNGLPEILKNIEETNSKIDTIENMLRGVENSILECAKTGEKLEVERKKHSLKIQLQRHKEEKEKELKKMEAVVQEEKQLTLERQEKLERSAHKERQEALDDIFKQQMSEYQKKGTVEKPILSEEEARDRAISELSIDNVEIIDTAGDKQLQEFLSDTEVTESENKQEILLD